MKFIKYKNTKISKLILGTVSFGLDYAIANNNGKVNKQEVANILQYSFLNGINSLDTAQAYGDCHNVLGDLLGGKNDIFIISKIKSNFFKDDITFNICSILDTLKINTLYGLLLHDTKILYNWQNKFTLLIDNLINTNKIKYFGVSIYTDEDFNLAIKNSNITFIQIPFSIFDQRAIKYNWFQKAKKNNKLLFIRSIFLQGLLLMDIEKIPKNLQFAKKYLIKYELFCKKLNVSKNTLALNFVDTIAKDSIILFGCDSQKQARENIEIYNNLSPLSSDIIQNISNDFKDIDENIYNPTKW